MITPILCLANCVKLRSLLLFFPAENSDFMSKTSRWHSSRAAYQRQNRFLHVLLQAQTLSIHLGEKDTVPTCYLRCTYISLSNNNVYISVYVCAILPADGCISAVARRRRCLWTAARQTRTERTKQRAAV